MENRLEKRSLLRIGERSWGLTRDRPLSRWVQQWRVGWSSIYEKQHNSYKASDCITLFGLDDRS